MTKAWRFGQEQRYWHCQRKSYTQTPAHDRNKEYVVPTHRIKLSQTRATSQYGGLTVSSVS